MLMVVDSNGVCMKDYDTEKLSTADITPAQGKFDFM